MPIVPKKPAHAEEKVAKVKPVAPPPKRDEVVGVERGKLSPDGVATV